MSEQQKKEPQKTYKKNQGKNRFKAGLLNFSDQLLPSNLFILPVSQAAVYPTLMSPLIVSHPKWVATVEEAISRDRFLGLLLKKEGDVTSSTHRNDLYTYGVTVKVVKRIKLPDGSLNLLVHSLKRFKVKNVLAEKPHIIVESDYLEDKTEKSTEIDALTRTVISQVKKLSDVNPFFTEEMKLAMINASGPGTVADLVAFALALPKDEAQKFIETLNVKERFNLLLSPLKREQEVADLQLKIQDDVNNTVDKMQREFFLKEQLKVIKKELGLEEEGKDKTLRSFREKIDALGMPEEAKKQALEEAQKFETISEHSPEYNVIRTYLETITSLPWSTVTQDKLDITDARDILDKDHYGLEKVKDRIIEFLAVRKLNEEQNLKTKRKISSEKKGSIICLVGPPGVGKTSVGKSIASVLGRNFYRFSLGGMRDEAEIKGHRRTYIGALPGKVIQAVKRAGSKNPVIMLDEVDKLGQSFQGDPSSALLEVLDPEQNELFLDHYLDVPFDLSQVLFIATANSRDAIPDPLLDRMEVIEIPGYTLEEKEKIATQFVIPRVLKDNGVKKSQIKINKATLKQILMDYAREPGLRSFQKMIEKIARKSAIQIVQGKLKKPITINKEELINWLGPKRFYNEIAERIHQPGVITGLAWTSTGGDILFIEVTDVVGSGKIKLTGQMGDVMTESADIAWTYIKKKITENFGFEKDYFDKRDFHLHIPAGAIPKDGPSAGITMAAALFSLVAKKVFKNKMAMTGELSLTGKVLPVGGIKEKLLAAKRAGIKEVILPKLNEKDLFEVPEYALKGMKVYWVSNIEEVLNIAFTSNLLTKKDKKVNLASVRKNNHKKILKRVVKKKKRKSFPLIKDQNHIQ